VQFCLFNKKEAYVLLFNFRLLGRKHVVGLPESTPVLMSRIAFLYVKNAQNRLQLELRL